MTLVPLRGCPSPASSSRKLGTGPSTSKGVDGDKARSAAALTTREEVNSTRTWRARSSTRSGDRYHPRAGETPNVTVERQVRSWTAQPPVFAVSPPNGGSEPTVPTHPAAPTAAAHHGTGCCHRKSQETFVSAPSSSGHAHGPARHTRPPLDVVSNNILKCTMVTRELRRPPGYVNQDGAICVLTVNGPSAGSKSSAGRPRRPARALDQQTNFGQGSAQATGPATLHRQDPGPRASPRRARNLRSLEPATLHLPQGTAPGQPEFRVQGWHGHSTCSTSTSRLVKH